jgi:hypothetical protein
LRGVRLAAGQARPPPFAVTRPDAQPLLGIREGAFTATSTFLAFSNREQNTSVTFGAFLAG